MTTSFQAKNIQPALSGSNTALSTAYGTNYPQFSRPRSHTAGRGFRTIDLQEHAFHYERACRDGETREAIQSPYLNGRKNKEYLNPTFHSSIFLNDNMTLRRAKTPDTLSSRAFNPLVQSTTAGSFRRLHEETPREDVVVNRKIDFALESARVENREVEKRSGTKSVSIREPAVEETVRIEQPQQQEITRAESKLSSSRSANYIEVCGGCHNWQLAHEASEAKRQQRDAELDVERSILDNNSRMLRNDQERERQKKELLASTSRSNYETFSEKKGRKLSREGLDDEVEIKLNSKSLAAESIRSLKRYQSMLDKMYESSMNRNSEKKGDLHKSQSHNKAVIAKNEQAKLQEKQTLVQWNLAEGEKSLLDTIHERSLRHLEMKDLERRRASEHNRHYGSARKFSPECTEDPFKADSGNYERAGSGKSVMDKMYSSSMDYWKKQKEGLKDVAQINKMNAALLKRIYAEEEEILAREYGSPGSARKPATLRGKSLLDVIHASDQKGASQRKDDTLHCSGYNKSKGYSEEIAQLKAKNMENYYRSPARKVNKGDGVDYDRWTEEGGVLHMISSSAERLHQNRKAENEGLGSTIRRQISDTKQKKREQQLNDRNFKQTPLLVCSHKANMACCAICNRQVPANKISKIIADYSNLAKARGSATKK